MKMIQFAEFGGPQVLKVVEAEEPHAGTGEIRIAVRAAAVNPPDWKIREGERQAIFPRELPSGVGFEASGIVDEVGEDVVDVVVGDAVFGFGEPTFAEYAVLNAWAKKPSEISFEEAAAMGVSGETALRFLDLLAIKPGETLLVSGAGGGAGSAIVRLARCRGATVIGTDAAAKHDYLRSLGAIPTTYEPGLVDRVRALAPNGVDKAIDVVGADVIPDLLELTGDPSRVASLMLKAADAGVLTSFARVDDAHRVLEELAAATSDGLYGMHVDHIYKLEETAEAQRASAASGVTGKLVVVPQRSRSSPHVTAAQNEGVRR